MWNKKIINALKLIVLIFLILFLFSKISINEFISSLSKINFFFLIIPILISFIGVLISTLKWKNILNFYNINESLRTLFKLYLMGSFYNNVLPSAIGGDIYKFYKLNKKFKNKKAILSSIILERGFGFLSLFLINIFILLFNFETIIKNSTLFFIEIIILIINIIIFIFLFIKFDLRIIKKYNFFIKIFNILDSVKSIKNKKNLIFFSLLMSIIFNLLSAFSLKFIFYGLGINVSLFSLIFVSVIIHFLSIIPISLNNIGINESAYVFLFSFFGILPEISLLASLIGRSLLILFSLTGGLIILKEKLSIYF
ncbi:MAG: lysylphosphatidylglycerol synthase transmembrane domain-containing protein [Methanobacterium sp.]|nr:lysylphosphatidylglycerol synthase transmembrane domain-containing protein [Methanobacterium sp.]